MRRFFWRYAIYLVLAACVLADLLVVHGPLYRWISEDAQPVAPELSADVARIGEETIGLRELEEALRDHLWRRGENWAGLSPDERKERRRAVLDQLIDDRLVRACRKKEADGDPAGSVVAARDETEMFARQFEKVSDLEARLALRQIREPELGAQVREAIDDQAWIESKLSDRRESVTEADVSRWLEANGPSMRIPPTFAVAHIYLTTHDAKLPDREPEIREIHRKLKAGEAAFEQLALQYSEDERSKKTGGKLGWCARGRMPDDFMDAVEKLTKGETSAPVGTRLGWHVIRLIDAKPGRDASLEEARNEVTAMLSAGRRDAALKALMGELRAEAGQSISLNQPLIDGAEPPLGIMKLEDRLPKIE